MTATMLTGLGIDEHFARTDSNGTMSYLTDMLGSTVALANSSGAITTQYTYDPFGATTVTGSSTNPFQFTGRENDGTGLYYYRARYYSPTLGRFISQDPLGFGGGEMDLYSYVANNPILGIDPEGTITPYRKNARTRDCTSDEWHECVEECAANGESLRSCKRAQLFRVVRAKGSLRKYRLVDGPLSCDCAPPPGGECKLPSLPKNKNVPAAAASGALSSYLLYLILKGAETL